MKKITFLFALLCASVMAFATAEDTWLGGNTAYSNQFKWFSIDGVTAPMEVVNIQTKNDFDVIYVNVGQADFDRETGIIGCEAITDAGAGVWIKINSLIKKNNIIYFKNSQGATLRGLVIYNDKGAAPIESEYCGYEGNETKSGDKYITLTWETQQNGDVLITMGTGTGATSCSFRNGGFEGGIAAFVVSTDNFETTTPASNYFTAAQVYSGNTYTLVKTADLPDNAKIKHVGSGHALAWTVDGDNAYSFPDFIYTYGGVCESSVFTEIKLSASTTIAKVDDAVTLTAKAVDQNGLEMSGIDIDLAVSPADMGSIVGGVFTFAKTGVATITASSAEKEASITLYGVPSDNLALNKTCEGGYYDNNPAESYDKANDGSTSTAWVTYADQPASKEWWYVDLEDTYSLTAVSVLWGDPASTSYILQVRTAAPSDEDKADDDAWETIKTVNEAGNNSEQFNVVTGVGRYMRLRSLTKSSNFLRLKEVRVYGTEYVPIGDDENPVMVSATLDSKTWNSVTIAVAATDNVGVTKYHVVNADPGIDVKLVANEGKITVTGLTAATDYNFTITAIDAAQNESDNSKTLEVTTNVRVIVPSTAAPTPTWPAAQVKSLYSDAYDFAPASLNSYNEGWWDAPTMTEETIGEDHYLHYDLYRNGMIGAQFAETSMMNMEKIHIDIFASAAGTVTFRPIIVDDGALNDNRKTLTLEAEQWNSFDIDMTDFGDHNWAKVFQFSIENYNAGGLVGEHISVDNVYFYRTTPLADTEAPTDVSASKLSESYFSAVLAVSAEDNSGAVNYVVKNGEVEVATSAGVSGETVNITVTGLTPNTDYTFNVIAKDEAGNAAAGVSVAVKTLVAPAAAPTPKFVGMETVVPVFTDAQAGGPAINFGSWGQTTIGSFVELAANDHVCYGSNFNFLGWELASSVDATSMTHLHVDFYTANLTKISVTPISPGKEGVKVVNLTADEWNSVDIELSDYDGKEIVWSNIFQFKFFDATPAGGELFIDNVYFYKPSATAIDNTVEATKVQKMIENGQLIIIKNGIRYNVAGQLVK